MNRPGVKSKWVRLNNEHEVLLDKYNGLCERVQNMIAEQQELIRFACAHGASDEDIGTLQEEVEQWKGWLNE